MTRHSAMWTWTSWKIMRRATAQRFPTTHRRASRHSGSSLRHFGYMQSKHTSSNQPAAPNPVIASQLHGGHHRREVGEPDRKSTRLNSSNSNISYAVFCFKKKKKYSTRTRSNYRARMSNRLVILLRVL